MRNNATIKDVAKLAGVSISTVSRVINAKKTVDDGLQKRVYEAIRKLDYKPNAIARGLKGNSMRLVAYVVSNTSDPFFTFISHGIEDRLFERGYNLINCSTFFSIERENTYLQTLSERFVDGFIINTVGKNDQQITELSKQFPVVLSNRAIFNREFRGDFVDFDNTGGLLELTNQMLLLGHKKIGVLAGPHFLSTATERLEGFKSAMSEAGLDTKRNYPYIYEAQNYYSYEEGYQATKMLMSITNPPTAIIATNGEMALGAMRYFREYGIRIPEDLSFSCYGNILHNELMFTNVSHMHMDLISFGTQIANLLIERIEAKNEICQREVRFSTVYQEGTSTAPPCS